jgi:hypothetical protein
MFLCNYNTKYQVFSIELGKSTFISNKKRFLIKPFYIDQDAASAAASAAISFSTDNI